MNAQHLLKSLVLFGCVAGGCIPRGVLGLTINPVLVDIGEAIDPRAPGAFISEGPPGNTTGGGNLQTIVEVAAEYWEKVFPDDDHELAIRYGWTMLPEDVFGNTGIISTSSTEPVRPTMAAIQFNNNLRTLLGVPVQSLFLDATPSDNNEYIALKVFTEDDLGGSVVNTQRALIPDPDGEANRPLLSVRGHFDVLTTALHEIGHAVGLAIGNPAFPATVTNGGITVSRGQFVNTRIPIDDSHIGALDGAQLMEAGIPGSFDGVRVYPSTVDILVNAEISQFDNPMLGAILTAGGVLVSEVGVGPVDRATLNTPGDLDLPGVSIQVNDGAIAVVDGSALRTRSGAVGVGGIPGTAHGIVSGPGSVWETEIDLGVGGNSKLEVSDGGRVAVSVTGGSNISVAGFGEDAVAELVVSGAGSEVQTGEFAFSVGGFEGGNGIASVRRGGHLRTMGAFIHENARVHVSGSGSQWSDRDGLTFFILDEGDRAEVEVDKGGTAVTRSVSGTVGDIFLRVKDVGSRLQAGESIITGFEDFSNLESNSLVEVWNGATLTVGDGNTVLPLLRLSEKRRSHTELNVGGAGSAVEIVGPSGMVEVGRRGTARVDIRDGGGIEGPAGMLLGRETGGRGELRVWGPQSHLSLLGEFLFDPGGSGAFLGIGLSGFGTAEVLNGGRIGIGPTSGTFSGFTLGRNEGSSGVFTIDGANSRVTVDSTVAGFGASLLQIGRAGTGRMFVTNGGRVFNDPDGFSIIGRFPTSNGLVRVSGPTSVWNVGEFLLLGKNFNFATGTPVDAGGVATLHLVNGGTVVTSGSRIEVGSSGNIRGSGTLVGDLVLDGGLLAPGLSTGTIFIDGDLVLNSGVLKLEANSLSDMDHVVVTGDATFAGGLIDVLLGFVPDVDDILNFFDVAGNINISESFGGVTAAIARGADVPVGTPVAVAVGDAVFVAEATVPEPRTILLLLVGLGLLAALRSRPGQWSARKTSKQTRTTNPRGAARARG